MTRFVIRFSFFDVYLAFCPNFPLRFFQLLHEDLCRGKGSRSKAKGNGKNWRAGRQRGKVGQDAALRFGFIRLHIQKRKMREMRGVVTVRISVVRVGEKFACVCVLRTRDGVNDIDSERKNLLEARQRKLQELEPRYLDYVVLPRRQLYGLR